MRNKTLAAVATTMMIGCAACTSKPSISGANTLATRTGSAVTAAAGAGPYPLVRSRLAPKQVGTPTPGTHCHMTGSTPATYRPDPVCTPGAVDPAVTQANIGSTICTTGYTTKVRPPSSATGKVKKTMYGDYGVADGTASELDHLVSLELGGSSDIANLWIEPGKLPNVKDQVEGVLHRAVCSHKVPLVAAQEAIATNWTTAETSLGIK